MCTPLSVKTNWLNSPTFKAKEASAWIKEREGEREGGVEQIQSESLNQNERNKRVRQTNQDELTTHTKGGGERKEGKACARNHPPTLCPPPLLLIPLLTFKGLLHRPPAKETQATPSLGTAAVTLHLYTQTYYCVV